MKFYLLKVCCMFAVLFVSPVIASETQPEVSLSDALFYTQLSNSQTRNSMVYAPQKDPRLAAAMSFLIPGLGQIYNGEPTKGTLHFATVVSGYYLGLSEFVAGTDHTTIGSLGLWFGLSAHIISIVDAPISANRINKENQQALLSLSPVIKPRQVGATFTLRW